MTGTSRKTQLKDRAIIDRAIENSMKESPDTAHAIAQKTGFHVTKVRRRFLALGWMYVDGRWIYRHNQPTREDDE